MTDANSPPVITSGGGGATAAASVAENSTAVTTVTATDPDAGTTITYSIVGGADAAKFTINASTGALAFIAAPDFEAPTDIDTDNVYNVTVRASDGTLSDDQAIAVTITNVNEAPVITSGGGGATAAASVAENSTAVTTVTATDPDAGTTITYSIVGGADAAKFTINASTGALALIAAPDFEAPTDIDTDNVYNVTVRASDGTLSDDQAIAVTITNVNEAPVITSGGGGATAAASVAENSTAVTTVTATDPDAGTTITYSIVGGADAAKFTINASTGALAFIAAPDFEAPTDIDTDNVYNVTVRASDGTLSDDQAIAVTITNVNEAPVITSGGGGATAAASVAENSTAVTTVTATDPDAGTTITYSIVGGADAAKFTIDASTGALAFIAAPDFEAPTDVGTDNVYNVTVRASDGTLSDDQAIAVTVTNVNENVNAAPTITSGGGGATATASVAENSTAVTTVTATDPDAGTTITYSIVGGADAAKFTINASTGALAFIAAPDFEAPTDVGADNVYNVTVRASDGTLSDTQDIAVTVTNVNDGAPGIARNDLFVTNEAILVGNVFADNGSGADSDIDSPLVVGAVQGQASFVGFDITLESGSRVRLSSDGTMTYTPGGSALQLAGPDSGASNISLSDSFTYALAGGGTATVTVVVQGTDGYDTLIGTSGVDSLFGGQFDDVLIGGLGADALNGDAGNDTASYAGDPGGVFVNLSTGRGYANSSFGDTYTSIENVIGTDFNDFVIGDTGVNRIDGGAGNDTIIGGLGADVLIGGPGIDTLSFEDNSGTVFVNLLTGMGYNNAAQGDTFSGFENVIGGLFDDTIIGDDGANRLDGAMGADTLVGNGGADTFVFSNAPGAISPYGSPNVDTIFDFVSGEDKLEINASVFGGGLAPGALAASAFVIGSAAGDADDRFVYDQANGNLYFDADGSGAGAQILVAILPNHDAIAATDFVIV